MLKHSENTIKIDQNEYHDETIIDTHDKPWRKEIIPQAEDRGILIPLTNHAIKELVRILDYLGELACIEFPKHKAKILENLEGLPIKKNDSVAILDHAHKFLCVPEISSTETHDRMGSSVSNSTLPHNITCPAFDPYDSECWHVHWPHILLGVSTICLAIYASYQYCIGSSAHQNLLQGTTTIDYGSMND